jgi:hypothetical protein
MSAGAGGAPAPSRLGGPRTPAMARAVTAGWALDCARPERALAAIVLGTTLIGACAWRLACVQVGPDPDTDAYGHYVIARRLLETPLNFKIHWVWLPLYHAVLALPVWLGASLDDVRSMNALGAALPPLLLFGALSARPRRPWRWGAGVPLIAALLTATSPLLMRLVTTGQMEVFFCSLLVLASALLARERFGWAALVLCALVLTRYEGWAVAALVAVVLVHAHRTGGRRLGAGALASMLLPGLCALAWVTLRRLGGEPWLGFLLDNQAFAARVLERHPETLGALGGLGRYTLSAPFRVFGVSAAFALIGLRRALREEGVWFVAPGLGILGFLTLSAMMRSQLGLDRHFLSVVPFAAIWIAHGGARVVEAIERTSERRWARLNLPAALILCAALAIGVGRQLEGSLSIWWNTTRTALREPREVARFLRFTPESSLIVCDDAMVEVLSGLPSVRFVRARLEAQTPSQVVEWARARDVYIVNRARNLGAFSDVGPPSYGTLDGPPDAFVAIRVPARAAHTNSLDG